MKKIMFNDSYGLTQSVLDGRKTMTRRIIKAPRTMDGKDVYGFSVVRNPQTKEVVEVMALDSEGAQINNILPKYKVGEVVAVAQSYEDIGLSFIAPPHNRWGCTEDMSGYRNKMFVLADLMPHRIRIKNVKVERLQDISNEDCLREGIIGYTCCLYEFRGECYSFPFDKAKMGTHKTPVEAFAALIDKVSGKGTWESNPWVWVYEFELVQ